MTPASSGESVTFDVRAATVRFGQATVLANITLRINRGERVAVIGPSGAGKSTLVGLLNGTVSPAAGEVASLGVRLDGASRRDLRRVRRAIGTIHQRLDLVDQLRTVHNVNAGKLAAWPWWKALLSLVLPRDVPHALAALERVGIAGKLHQRTGDLSGGERQRVAIARVLVQQPSAILADEPVASLDPARAVEVVNLLLDLTTELRTTLVMCLHDVDLALRRFDRVVGLRGGSIVFDAPPAELDQHDIMSLYAIEAAAGL